MIPPMFRMARACAQQTVWVWLTGLALAWLVPLSAHACPSCFTGNNSNSQAFVWGSLLLMTVPVLSIGSLLYWFYRRERAFEERTCRPASKAPHVSATNKLRVVEPR
jgi:hypothetical protein